MDLVGPFPVPTIHGQCKSFLNVVDDYSRYGYVETLRTKDQVIGFVITYLRKVAVQKETKVKALRMDNGSEFVNKEMMEYCDQNGINLEINVSHSPQQDGAPERRHQSVMNISRAIRIDAKLPKLIGVRLSLLRMTYSTFCLRL